MKSPLRPNALILGFLSILSLFSTACKKPLAENQNLIHSAMTIDHRERTFYLYLPESLKADAPLVFVLHGYTDNARNMMESTGMNTLADKYGFAVCYPQGLTDSSKNTFWQVGYSFHQNMEVDDVSFLSTLALHLQSEYRFSKTRTFATGMSNGGDMCNMLACQASDIFKAVAPVAGCMMKGIFDSCAQSSPIPVFMTNGNADPITWWEGDMADKQGYGPYLSVEENLQFHIARNNCSLVADSDTLIPENDTPVITQKYIHSAIGHQVWMYTVENGKHDWPVMEGEFDIAEEIWKFFSVF
ncbi:MAG: PHB depolymerase family esterase [Bacteroidia bacterium]